MDDRFVTCHVCSVTPRENCRRLSSIYLLITNRLSPFWKHVVPTKHCGMMYSSLTINFLNHFKCFCGIKTSFPAKTNRCTLFSCFFHYDLWHGQNRQVTSCQEYVPHSERFELKRGKRGEEVLLTNFLKFHGDRATSTMFSQRAEKRVYWRTSPSFMEIVLLVLFSQRCRKTYLTDFALYIS